MLISIITFLVGLIGVALVSVGAWLIYQPAGLIVCGVLLLFWSFLMSRALAGPAQGGN